MPIESHNFFFQETKGITWLANLGLAAAFAIWPFSRRPKQSNPEKSQSRIEAETTTVDLVEWGIRLGQLGKPELAAQRLTRATKINPEDASAYYNLGLALLQTKQYAQAREAFDKAIELCPDLVAAYINLGCTFYAMGEYESALREFQKAVEKAEDDPDAWFGLGCCYLALGNGAESVKAFQQALKLKPSDFQATFNLAYALQKQGQMELAENHFRSFLETTGSELKEHRDYAQSIIHSISKTQGTTDEINA